MKKEIDLYIDLPTTYLATTEHLIAMSSPNKLPNGYDRYRITIRLDEKYFKDAITGDAIVEELKQIKNDNN